MCDATVKSLLDSEVRLDRTNTTVIARLQLPRPQRHILPPLITHAMPLMHLDARSNMGKANLALNFASNVLISIDDNRQRYRVEELSQAVRTVMQPRYPSAILSLGYAFAGASLEPNQSNRHPTSSWAFLLVHRSSFVIVVIRANSLLVEPVHYPVSYPVLLCFALRCLSLINTQNRQEPITSQIGADVIPPTSPKLRPQVSPQGKSARRLQVTILSW